MTKIKYTAELEHIGNSDLREIEVEATHVDIAKRIVEERINRRNEVVVRIYPSEIGFVE